MSTLTHLQRLEAESIHIFREVVAEVENPAMLYSIGKDSAVLLHVARRSLHPRFGNSYRHHEDRRAEAGAGQV